MRKVLPPRAVLVPEHAKLVFKGEVFEVYQWPQEMFDGSVATFEMLKRPDTVKVIAIRGDKIVITEQEQPHIGKFYDIPGGLHDYLEEDELQACKRELLEETGLKFKTWKLLSVEQPATKIEQFIYTFLATDFEGEEPQSLDAGEKITVRLMSLEEAKEMLGGKEGRFLPRQIEDAKSIDDLLNLPEYKG